MIFENFLFELLSRFSPGPGFQIFAEENASRKI
jgi:hypothetical protein